MAQLSGVMTADFSDFMFEIDKSVVKLKELEGASVTTDSALGGMADGLGQVDKTLNLFGVRLGPQVQALRELGSVAGLTYDKLGLWGSLGAVGASFAAGWQIGTWITQWTNLDEAIGNATARLLGWGDVAAANAGAQTEALALATQRAGRAITDINEAIAINVKWTQQHAAALNTGTQRLADWDRQISKVRNSGDLQTITKELNEKSSTVAQLATRFNISAEAITHYMNRTKESTAILEKWREAEAAGLKKITDAQTELDQAGGGWRDTLLTIAPAAAAAATAYIAMGESLTTIATAGRLSEIQVQALDKAYKEQTAQLAALEPKLGSLDTWMFTVGKQFAVAAESGDQFKTMLELTGDTATQTIPEIEKLDTTFRSLTEGMKPEQSKNAPGSVPFDIGPLAFTPGRSIQDIFQQYSKTLGGGAMGGFIGGGPPKDFISWALSMGLATKGGGGASVNNTFNIVDTESGIARRVGDTITSQIERGSLVS